MSTTNKTKKLTHKREKFVQAYVNNGGNGVQAAMEVFNTNTYQSAGAIASTLLKNVNVQASVKSLTEQVQESIICTLQETGALRLAMQSALTDISNDDPKIVNSARKFILDFAKAGLSNTQPNVTDNRKLTLNIPKRS